MAPSGSCLHNAAAAVQAYRDAGHRIAHMAEDELVGLCMQLHSVPLVECPCFYQYGPCDVHNFTTCADGTRSSRLCRLPHANRSRHRPGARVAGRHGSATGDARSRWLGVHACGSWPA